jgi:hypothetical protein
MAGILWSGTLSKRGSSFPYTWHRRFFEIRGSSLYVYEKEGGKERAQHSLLGVRLTPIPEPKFKRAHACEVGFLGDEPLSVCADSAEELERFAGAVSRAAAAAPPAPAAPRSPAPPRGGSSAPMRGELSLFFPGGGGLLGRGGGKWRPLYASLAPPATLRWAATALDMGAEEGVGEFRVCGAAGDSVARGEAAFVALGTAAPPREAGVKADRVLALLPGAAPGGGARARKRAPRAPLALLAPTDAAADEWERALAGAVDATSTDALNAGGGALNASGGDVDADVSSVSAGEGGVGVPPPAPPPAPPPPPPPPLALPAPPPVASAAESATPQTAPAALPGGSARAPSPRERASFSGGGASLVYREIEAQRVAQQGRLVYEGGGAAGGADAGVGYGVRFFSRRAHGNLPRSRPANAHRPPSPPPLPLHVPFMRICASLYTCRLCI